MNMNEVRESFFFFLYFVLFFRLEKRFEKHKHKMINNKRRLGTKKVLFYYSASSDGRWLSAFVKRVPDEGICIDV